MIQRLAALRVMSDDFFQNSFFERKIVIFTLQFDKIILYVKPQPYRVKTSVEVVVIVFFSTSNHNKTIRAFEVGQLLLFFFLHQTTTLSEIVAPPQRLLLFFFLHQTTTDMRKEFIAGLLLLFFFLHQTTTRCFVHHISIQLLLFFFLHQTTTRCQ